MQVLANAVTVSRDRGLLAAMIGALVVVPVLAPGTRPISPISAVALMLLPCLAAGCFVHASRRRAMGTTSFWLVLAAVLLLAAVGGGLLALRESGWDLGRVAYPVIEGCYVTAIILALAALLLSPAAGNSAVGRARRVMDGTVIAAAMFCTLWALGIRPHAVGPDSPPGLAALGYPIFDAIMVTLILQLLAGSRTNRMPLVALSAGLFAVILANTGLAIATARNADLPGWIYGVRAVGFVWLGLGSLSADQQPPINSAVGRVQRLLPYAAALVGGCAAYAALVVSGRLDSVLVTGGLTMFLLVVGRQWVVAQDNLSLVLEREAGRVREAGEAARAEVAERANKATEHFLASMSHEFRTPLNSILGFAELGLMLGMELDPRTRRYLHNIRAGGRHMLALVNDVLDLSKVRAGRLELELTPVEAVAVANECLAQLAPLATQKNVTLRAPRGQVFVIADERRLGQILLNLLSNAVKFTPSRGQVTISVVGVGLHVEISVTDTGVGIAPEDRERVFAEYGQVSSSGSDGLLGTGLGLPLSRQLAHLMRGTIELESALGSGSTFTVRLLAADACGKGAPSTDAKSRLHPRSVNGGSD